MKIFNFNISSAVLLLLGIILFALVIRPRASPKEGFKLFANPIKEVKSVMEGLGMIDSPKDDNTVIDDKGDDDDDDSVESDDDSAESDDDEDSN